ASVDIRVSPLPRSATFTFRSELRENVLRLSSGSTRVRGPVLLLRSRLAIERSACPAASLANIFSDLVAEWNSAGLTGWFKSALNSLDRVAHRPTTVGAPIPH